MNDINKIRDVLESVRRIAVGVLFCAVVVMGLMCIYGGLSAILGSAQ